MVHLVIHLVEEAKLGGPVHYRWMYPIERYLAHLKSCVTNKAQPERSITEGYHLEEMINFCSRYLEEIETLFYRLKRNDDLILDTSAYLFNSGGRFIGAKKIARLDAKSLEQAHHYVLLHFDEMAEFRDEFLHQKRRENRFREVRGDTIVEYDWIIKDSLIGLEPRYII